MLDSLLTTTTVPSLQATELEDLLNYLKRAQKVDLTGYKRSTLLRRILVRMQQVGVEHYQAYLDCLQQHHDEVSHLLDTVFINFTLFFRDRHVWDYLANSLIPQMIANKAPNEPIRVWSAGCASGEETYSLAILLAEALGIEQFQQRVRVYGTDVDLDAILCAQKGWYSPRAVVNVPPDLLERYFERSARGYRWRQDLCSSIVFHHHDLIQAPPLPRIDLLVCRNMLMYLTPDTQGQALDRFHFSLQPHGFLVLGQAENLVTRSEQSPLKLIHPAVKLFTKVPDVKGDGRLLPMAFPDLSGLKDDWRNETVTTYPSSLASSSPENYEQQPGAMEEMRHEIEWLREQVRLLQDELCDRIQQQDETDQELKATQKELEWMNQEVQDYLGDHLPTFKLPLTEPEG